jgi:hypothetical protein
MCNFFAYCSILQFSQIAPTILPKTSIILKILAYIASDQSYSYCTVAPKATHIALWLPKATHIALWCLKLVYMAFNAHSNNVVTGYK